MLFCPSLTGGEWGLLHVLREVRQVHVTLAGQRIMGTVLLIIFHLLQFLYYSESDTCQSCQLANTSAEVFDGFQDIVPPCLFKALDHQRVCYPVSVQQDSSNIIVGKRLPFFRIVIFCLTLQK